MTFRALGWDVFPSPQRIHPTVPTWASTWLCLSPGALLRESWAIPLPRDNPCQGWLPGPQAFPSPGLLPPAAPHSWLRPYLLW